jgi:hypothetical protein
VARQTSTLLWPNPEQDHESKKEDTAA